jgi:hypothetical protein
MTSERRQCSRNTMVTGDSCWLSGRRKSESVPHRDAPRMTSKIPYLFTPPPARAQELSLLRSPTLGAEGSRGKGKRRFGTLYPSAPWPLGPLEQLPRARLQLMCGQIVVQFPRRNISTSAGHNEAPCAPAGACGLAATPAGKALRQSTTDWMSLGPTGGYPSAQIGGDRRGEPRNSGYIRPPVPPCRAWTAPRKSR